MIANRRLKLRNENKDVEVMVRIFAPARDGKAWSCRYEIDWPDGQRAAAGVGYDSTQALLYALQMVAAELYSSEFHEAGKLMWTEPSQGYGFPVAQSLRDRLVGDDAKYL